MATNRDVGCRSILRGVFVETKGVNHTIEIWEDNHGQWYWRIRHHNGQIICSSEGYESQQSARDTIMGLLESFRACFQGPDAEEAFENNVTIRVQKQ